LLLLCIGDLWHHCCQHRQQEVRDMQANPHHLLLLLLLVLLLLVLLLECSDMQQHGQ
jgi:hypothetical protein